MGLNAIKILGVAVTTEKKEKILEEIQKGYSSPHDFRGKPLRKTPKIVTIVTPNPEILMEADRNPVFRDVLNKADVALPDGIGVRLAARILRWKDAGIRMSTLPEVLHGVDIMEDLVVMACKNRVPIGLIGGTGGIALKALECLKKTHPGLTGWSMELPQMSASEMQLAYTAPHRSIQKADSYVSHVVLKVVTAMEDHPVGMVFIALGAPKQELFLCMLQDALSKRVHEGREQSIFSPQIVLMGVGGAFNMISGVTPRAPVWMRSVGLEWFWRLLCEPWRLPRQWNLVRFMVKIVKA